MFYRTEATPGSRGKTYAPVAVQRWTMQVAKISQQHRSLDKGGPSTTTKSGPGDEDTKDFFKSSNSNGNDTSFQNISHHNQGGIER